MGYSPSILQLHRSLRHHFPRRRQCACTWAGQSVLFVMAVAGENAVGMVSRGCRRKRGLDGLHMERQLARIIIKQGRGWCRSVAHRRRPVPCGAPAAQFLVPWGWVIMGTRMHE